MFYCLEHKINTKDQKKIIVNKRQKVSYQQWKTFTFLENKAQGFSQILNLILYLSKILEKVMITGLTSITRSSRMGFSFVSLLVQVISIFNKKQRFF